MRKPCPEGVQQKVCTAGITNAMEVRQRGRSWSNSSFSFRYKSLNSARPPSYGAYILERGNQVLWRRIGRKSNVAAAGIGTCGSHVPYPPLPRMFNQGGQEFPRVLHVPFAREIFQTPFQFLAFEGVEPLEWKLRCEAGPLAAPEIDAAHGFLVGPAERARSRESMCPGARPTR